MKTPIIACALLFATNVTFASGWWEDVWQSPDMDPKWGNAYYLDFAPVVPTGGTLSLEDFNRGNPDTYVGLQETDKERARGLPDTYYASSLDNFTRGNPDIDTHSGFRGDGDIGAEEGMVASSRR